MNRPGRPRLVVVAPLVLAATASVALFSGCPKPQPSVPSGEKGRAESKGDPWEAAVRQLRQNTDAATCKSAISQLNNDLSKRSDLSGPPVLTPDAEKALADLIPFHATDRDEVRASGYTNLDPAYLADCFYLHDAARSLDLTGLPPAQAAELAFAWVCRQVYLNPWRMKFSGESDLIVLVPPTYTLRRGFGATLERAYVFLAMLQQIGLDGCLIGPPDAADKPATAPFPNGNKVPPRGPFWAVGVRIGSDIRLFDPWRGAVFPGTLAQVKANPDLLKAWLDDKADPWDVTADEVKKSIAFLSVPVSALSPRMAMLDEKLKADTGVRLAINPTALRDRFTTAAPNGPGLPAAEVKFWNPPNDRFAYGRVLAGFLPLGEGGLDREQEGSRLFDLFIQKQVPLSVVFQFPAALKEVAPKERLQAVAFLTYKTTFLDSPTPRERIQRGQFQDAARYLTAKQDEFERGLARLRAIGPEEIMDWCTAANEAYATLSRAKLDGDPSRVAGAQADIDHFWRTRTATAQVLVDQASASLGKAEATYLLALTKHEAAERLQVRAERATGADAATLKADARQAWKQAADLWAAYEQQKETQAGFAGRIAQALMLSNRAKSLAAMM